MTEVMREFTRAATALARNPLGIIALFIVLVYGFAALTTIFATNLTAAERQPLIYFLVLFPVAVLLTYIYLVTRHHGKLYAPRDYRDDTKFLEAAALLGASFHQKSQSADWR